MPVPSPLTACWQSLHHPDEVEDKHRSIVKYLGKIGFVTKAIVYGIIGSFAVYGATSANKKDAEETNESPQGAFLFLASQPKVGRVLLIIMLTGVITYAIWRLWEGITGQGYQPSFGRWKNFFRFRLSPIVSGLIYVAYVYYIVTVLASEELPKQGETNRVQDKSCFPVCWKNSVIGQIGLFLLAVAFIIATLTQLATGLRAAFIRDMDQERRKRWYWGFLLFVALGCIGFIARGALFFSVAFLFFFVLFRDERETQLNETNATVSQALNFASQTMAGKVLIGLVGCGLICYAVFAFLNVYFKVFPSQTYSSQRVEDAERDRSHEEDLEMDLDPDLIDRDSQRIMDEMDKVARHENNTNV